MIKYSLKCKDGHSFDSWFQSADAFDTLKAAGHVTCMSCGSTAVEKAIMAPKVSTGRDLTAPASETEQKIAAMRKHVEENSTYVGGAFAKEARKMHEDGGEARSIWGEAKPAEAKALIEEGVPVVPLPFTPKAKTN